MTSTKETKTDNGISRGDICKRSVERWASKLSELGAYMLFMNIAGSSEVLTAAVHMRRGSRILDKAVSIEEKPAEKDSAK